VNHRQVRKCRQWRAECAVEKNLFWCVGDMVVARITMVIAMAMSSIRRQDCRWACVRAEDDEILDVLVRERDAFVDHVIPFGCASGTRNRITYGSPAATFRSTSSRDSRSQRRSYLNASLLAAAARRRSSSSAGVQKTAIRAANLEEPLRIGLVALEIGALVYDAVVPVEAQPLQPIEDGARALVGAPCLIGVLDAEKELSANLRA